MTEECLRAIFLLAGVEIQKAYRIMNEYYREDSEKMPWWLVKTSFGMVKIGWRKRVINIDWSDTPVRVVLTSELVTKSESMIHAYGYHEAVEYIQKLDYLARRAAALALREATSAT